MFDVFHVNEIHSSFFDVWFSYGLIPTTFLVYWIVKNVIRCEKAQRAAVLALLAESFTLMNCRQPFFWFVIVMAGMSGKKEEGHEFEIPHSYACHFDFRYFGGNHFLWLAFYTG